MVFFDEFLSAYVKRIDAFDYSKQSIENAKMSAREKGIGNINYYVGDAVKQIFKEKYDAILLLGVTVYIGDNQSLTILLDNIRESLKDGGVVVVRDSLNISESGMIYNHSFVDGYDGYCAFYREKKQYELIWHNLGFHILCETTLASDISLGVIKKHLFGYLFEKE